jgi:hypothetical protein
MTFPTGTTIPTTNLDSPDDDPSLARSDLYNLVLTFNQLVASANLAQGVSVLDATAKVPSANLPSTQTYSGNLVLVPDTKIVNIRYVLRLQPQATADLSLLTPAAGDLTFLSDGDAGSPCLGCYDGTNWKVIRLMTQVGDVGAALTTTATLSATADA